MIIDMFSDLISFQRDPLRFFEAQSKKPGPLTKLKMGPFKTYMVVTPDAVKPVLASSEAKIDKGRLIYKLREVIGDSSMVISGQRHKERRAAIHQQIAKGAIGDFVPIISAVVRREIVQLSTQEHFEGHEVTSSLAVRIIANLLFGEGVLNEADEAILIKALHLAEDDLAAEIFKVLPDAPWTRARKKRRMAEAKENMNFVVQKARKHAKNHSIISGLEALNLTEKEISEEILLLLLAGHHTSGSAAAWMLYYLATQPETAEKIRAEALECMKDDGEFDPKALARADTSLAFVKEVLRLYPSAYWLSRETKVPMEIGGTKLPKGASILVSPWQLQRDARNWENPEDFDLSRDHKGNAYLPFGMGPRVCVGMSLGILELQIMLMEFAMVDELGYHSGTPGRPIPAITIIPPEMKFSLNFTMKEREITHDPITKVAV